MGRCSRHLDNRGVAWVLAPPVPPPPTQQKFVIHQNLRNRLNCTQNLTIKKKIKVFVGRFLVMGGASGANISIFLEDLIRFLLMWGRQNVN